MFRVPPDQEGNRGPGSPLWAALYQAVHGPGDRRARAVEELDDRLGNVRSFVALQRTAVVAPLVGVLITALALGNLHLARDHATGLSGILESVQPLFQGILAGAGLAIINQVLLFFVTIPMENLRREAKAWCYLRLADAEPAAPAPIADEVFSALRDLGASIRDAQAQYAADVDGIQNTQIKLAVATDGLGAATESLGQTVAALGKQVDVAREAADAVKSTADVMSSTVGATAQALEKAAERFQQVIDGQLATAANHFENAAALSRESAESFNQSALNLTNTCDQLQESAAAHNDALVEFKATVAEGLASTKTTMKSLEGAVVALRQFSEKGLQPAMERLGSLAKVIQTMEQAAANLAKLPDLQAEFKQLHALLGEMHKTARSFQAIAELRPDVDAIKADLSEAATAIGSVRSLPEEFKAKLTLLTDQLLDRQVDELRLVLSQVLRRVYDLGLEGRYNPSGDGHAFNPAAS